MYTYIILRQNFSKKNTFAISGKNFCWDYSLHTQSPTQRKPLSWTFCSTLTCVCVRDISTSNDVNGYQLVSAMAPATLIQWPLWSCCWCAPSPKPKLMKNIENTHTHTLEYTTYTVCPAFRSTLDCRHHTLAERHGWTFLRLSMLLNDYLF